MSEDRRIISIDLHEPHPEHGRAVICLGLPHGLNRVGIDAETATALGLRLLEHAATARAMESGGPVPPRQEACPKCGCAYWVNLRDEIVDWYARHFQARPTERSERA